MLPFSSRYLQLFRIPYRFAKEFLRASRQDRKNTGMAVRISVVTRIEKIFISKHTPKCWTRRAMYSLAFNEKRWTVRDQRSDI